MSSRNFFTLMLSLVYASIFFVSSAQNKTEQSNNVIQQLPDSISAIDIINNDSTSTIEIIQPELLNERIINLSKEEPKKDTPKKVHTPKKDEKIATGKTKITEGKRISYTIIAFNKPNQRDNAKAIAQKINSKFPGYRARVTSNLPYWQVSVGPFFDENDAKKAMSNIRGSIPGTTPSLRKKNIVITR